MVIIPPPGERIVLDDQQRQLDARQCHSVICAIADALRAEGLMAGDTVALLARNTAEYPLWLMGAVVAGLWVVPVNWHLKAGEIRHIIQDSGARLLLAEPALLESLQSGPDGELPHWRLDEQRWRALMAAEPVGTPQPADPAGGIMLYTSGTTGLPKGVRRSQPATLGALLDDWRKRGHGVGLDGSGPHLVTGPLYHAAPLLYALYDWINGAPLLIMRRFDAATALDWMAQAQVRHTHWVPTMFVRASRLPEDQRTRFAAASSLNLVLHGAAPIAVALKRQMIDWWGPVLVEYWGGSESGAITRVDSEEWRTHSGTVGRALPQFEVFAVDAQGQRLAPGEQGLLAVRAKSGGRIFEYFRAPEKTERSHIGDALLLGDIGYVDAEGFVYLLDRESHTIISGGVNIYPAEIEAVFGNHPSVADVAVCSEPDEEWGERVIAKVQWVAAETDAADHTERIEYLLHYAGQHLADYKLPRRIDTVEQLPRTDSGKLYRRLLD